MTNSRHLAFVCSALALLIGVGCSRAPAPGQKHAGQVRSPTRVTVVEPERGPVSHDLSLTATVEAYEQALLYAKVSGYVKSLPVDIGDRVTKGQVLAALEVPELQQ